MTDFIHLHDMLVMLQVLRGPPSTHANLRKSGRKTGNVCNPRGFNSPGIGVGLQTGHQERCMNKLAIRLLTLAMLSLTLAAAPIVTVVYAAPDNDPPPPDKGKKKKSSEARPAIEQTAFADGYRAAYATIYDRHDYASAITQLKALGRD